MPYVERHKTSTIWPTFRRRRHVSCVVGVQRTAADRNSMDDWIVLLRNELETNNIIHAHGLRHIDDVLTHIVDAYDKQLRNVCTPHTISIANLKQGNDRHLEQSKKQMAQPRCTESCNIICETMRGPTPRDT